MVDEQPAHLHRTREGSSGVVAQVEHDAFDAFFFQLGDLFGQVVRAFPAVFVFKIDVELRYVDHSVFVPVLFHHGRAYEGLFEFHHVAYQGYFLDGSIGLLYFQAYGRAFLAPDQIDGIVQAHADDIDVFIASLGHFQDLVAHRQLSAFGGRRSRHDAGNGGIAVLLLQDGSDAFQLSRDAGVEVFFLPGCHVLGVRVEIHREGVEVHREPVLFVQFVDPLEVVPEVLQYGFPCFFLQFFGRFGHVSAVFGGFVLFGLQVAVQAGQHVVLQITAPAVHDLSHVAGIGRIIGVERFLHGEVHRGGQQRVQRGGNHFHPGLEYRGSRVEKHRIPGENLVVYVVAIAVQQSGVRLGEVALAEVEGLEVLVVHRYGQRIVDGFGVVVPLADDVGHQLGEELRLVRTFVRGLCGIEPQGG